MIRVDARGVQARFADFLPPNLEDLRVRDSQGQFDLWGIAVSGTKGQLVERLQKLYRGALVQRCPIKLEEHKGGGLPNSCGFGILGAHVLARDASSGSSGGSTVQPRISKLGYGFSSTDSRDHKKAEGYEGKGVVDPRSGLWLSEKEIPKLAARERDRSLLRQESRQAGGSQFC